MKKAIKIDVEQKKIYYIEIGDYQTIYPAIGNGCNTFTIPIDYPNGDALYCDDEGCMQSEIKGGFTMQDFREGVMIVNNAIILGTDSEGESVDALSDIDEIAEGIIFVDENMARDYAHRTLNRPIEIITW